MEGHKRLSRLCSGNLLAMFLHIILAEKETEKFWKMRM